MNLSHSIKKRFVKDFGLPIQVVQEPVFTYCIETLDDHYSTKEKFQMLLDVVEATGGEEGFFAESNRVKGKLIEAISGKEVYTELQKNRLEDYNVVNKVRQQNIYNMENVGKFFVSMDMKHANFNVFKDYDPELVLGFDTYEEMVGSVTEFDYFKKSKYLRQVIFGNLLPKKQQRLQKKVMDDLITELHKNAHILMECFVSASSDEVVFQLGEEGVRILKPAIEKVLENPAFENIRLEIFKMGSIGGKKYFTKKNVETGEVTFKGIPSLVFMQVFKFHYGLPLVSKDLVFYHEGFLAEFKETVFENQVVFPENVSAFG